MTVLEWLGALKRQWWVVAGGLTVTVVLALLTRASATVYWSETTVQLVPPSPSASQNVLILGNEGLISLAGVIVLEANRQSRVPRLASDSVSIVDAGIAEGRLIRLPNSGGQWAANFDRAAIDVQVAGPNPERVTSEMYAAIAELSDIMSQIQDRYGVALEERVSLQAQIAPTVRAGNGSPIRTLLAAMGLGSSLTVGAALWADQIRIRPRGRRVLG